jgi:hypothetical protein
MSVKLLCRLADLLELRAAYRNERYVFGEGFEETMAGELLEILEDEIELTMKEINDAVLTNC